MPHQIVVLYQYTCGDLVHYNHGAERFCIEALRYTYNATTANLTEYLIASPTGSFWARENALSAAEEHA